MSGKNILTRSKKQKALALFQSGQIEAARVLFERVCRTDPSDAEAWCAHGVCCGTLGLFDHSVTSLRRAITLRPEYTEARYNLANSLAASGSFEEAIQQFQETLRSVPDHVETLCNPGSVFGELSRHREAAEYYRRAVSINPGIAEAQYNLGNALVAQGLIDEGIRCYRQALRIKPGYADAHTNLGNALDDQGLIEEAFSHYLEAIRLNPLIAEEHSNLARALTDQGRLEEALFHYREALRIKPEYSEAHSNLLFTLNYDPATDPAEVHREHIRYGEAHAGRLDTSLPLLNAPDPNRRLRIGYLSPDFYTHSVAYFIESILANHDPAQTEIFCYANNKRSDETTERLKGLVAHWRNTWGIADARVADTIQSDNIDVLVDLAGHTAHSRLLVFARKPAPVQVSYLGYPNTTGLAAMDYYLTDAWADPPGMTEKFYTEKVIRLPRGLSCYRPIPDAPEAEPLPVLTAGHITLASFNNLAKINHAVISLWAQILHKLPDSRLLVQDKAFANSSVQSKFREQFEQKGITANRLELMKRTGLKEHLALHQHVDIGLDSFPWNGHTTTCHTLWMGVPVITLSGKTHAGRLATSLLNQIGLEELVANTPEEYIDKTVRLATDLPRLGELRRSMRQRLLGSPLCNGAGFTRDLEAAYREMWKKYCDQRQAS
ncbi:MAG: tetratricopeptide repeat protein [Pseudomonadota bacterium]